MSFKVNFPKLKETIFSALSNEKEREVLIRRFSLNSHKRETLEKIGKRFGVTRERIRQIEKTIFKKLSIDNNLKDYLNKVKSLISQEGGLVSFKDLVLKTKASGQEEETLLFLILNSNTDLKEIENKDFKKSWHLRTLNLSVINEAERKIRNFLANERIPVVLNVIIQAFKNSNIENKKLIASIVLISNNIGKDIEGKFGLMTWGVICPKNTRDRAYVIFKKIKKPLHYKKLTELMLGQKFKNYKKISVEAVHNELIRDNRFVLVGRGLYALKEWGYKPGTVADVMEEMFKEANRPMHKEEIIEKVLDKRFVKKNTILLNLQEKPQFIRVERSVYRLKD